MDKYFKNTTDYKSVDYTYLLLVLVESRLYVTLNRANKRNAFTPLMINELAYVMQGVNEDEGVKVVVLQALGPVFCAGMDLKIFRGESKEEIPQKFASEGITMSLALRQLDKPLVAVCEGPVIAGGFLIINESTLVLAREDVWFSLPEIEIGLFPFQVMEKLPSIVGERKAMQYALTGQKIDTQEALSSGLINEIFTKDSREEVLSKLISKVENAEVGLLTAAMKSMKMLKSLPEKERIPALKEILDSFSGSK
ncbi:Enoyl-CoA hydratase/carnithine racemase [Spirosomataceae bacterium TFI 002]|nr:Enoyl-CoA hydratase/carnithine racemase [Spirosomataceae bacterium TFI 002]